MGCDIHLYAEVRRGGDWQYVPLRERYKVGEYTEEEGGGDKIDYAKWFDDDLYVGRNYDLFAILANVRNGRGFAGGDTGDGFVPISKPRGVPKDASREYLQHVVQWKDDGHSHSFLTVAELDAYDWNQTTKHRGWVDLKEYKVFKETGTPPNWYGGVVGACVKHVSAEDMDRLLSGEDIPAEGLSYYTRVEWPETYAASCEHFLTKTLPALRALDPDPNNVRVVFFFDN